MQTPTFIVYSIEDYQAQMNSFRARAAAGPAADDLVRRKERLEWHAHEMAKPAPPISAHTVRLLSAEVSLGSVPYAARQAADRALIYGGRRLGLTVSARWYRASFDPSAGGLYEWDIPTAVWLADNTHRALAAVNALHELRHAWQHRHWDAAALSDENRLESDARAWSQHAAGALEQDTRLGIV